MARWFPDAAARDRSRGWGEAHPAPRWDGRIFHRTSRKAMVNPTFMPARRQSGRSQELVMRYAPAAVALSLLAGVTASVSYGASRAASPAAVALERSGQAQLNAGKVQEA